MILECKCLHCGSLHIYVSRWLFDYFGTLTCLKCGETEDAKSGISFKGQKIETFRRDGQNLFKK
jgi:hypothetical protein